MSEYLSSTRNYLLNRDDVGKPRPTTRRLPSMDFAYGHPPNKDPEGVREVIGTWKYHYPSQIANPGRDFTKLNKISLACGVANPKSHFQFRNSVDPRLPVKVGQAHVKYYLPEEEFTYGIANRPSTPIKQVIGGEFGNHSALLIEELYRSRAEEKNRLKGQKYSPRSTKTNELMYSTAKDRVRAFSVGHKTFEGFKIRKFRNVPCRTDHKNSEYIRTRSQMQSDKASTIYKLSSLPNGSADKRTNEVISITNQNVE